MSWKKVHNYLTIKNILLTLLFVICATVAGFIIVWLQVLDPKDIGTIVTAITVFMQAVFAGVLLIFVYRQTEIIGKQTDISKSMLQLNHYRDVREDYKYHISQLKQAIDSEAVQKHLLGAAISMTFIKAFEKKLDIPVDLDMDDNEFEKVKKETLEDIYKEIVLKEKSPKD